MRLFKNSHTAVRGVLFFMMMCVMPSCNKYDEGKNQNGVHGSNEETGKGSCVKFRDANASLAEDIEAGTWEVASYNDVFQFLVTATNMTLPVASRTMSMVCKRIDEVSDDKAAFKLYDTLLEYAITREITIAEFNRRQNWMAELWEVAWRAFVRAQRKQGNDFAYWDKMFRFYEKYINEIEMTEKKLSKNESDVWSRSDYRRGSYLHGIRGELKIWVRVMRDFHFPKIGKDYTPEQKADILRRFKEVEKYTVTPPHYPGGRKVTE